MGPGTTLLNGCEALPRALHWQFGWWLVLVGMVSGAMVGLFFLRDDFLGGYASRRRRLVRLGHVALIALGIVNVVVSLAIPTMSGDRDRNWITPLLLSGSVLMPAVCFLTAWRASFRAWFPVPVLALLAAIALLLFQVPAPPTSGVSP